MVERERKRCNKADLWKSRYILTIGESTVKNTKEINIAKLVKALSALVVLNIILAFLEIEPHLKMITLNEKVQIE